MPLSETMKNYLAGIFFSLLFLIIAGAAIYVIVAIIKDKQDFLNPKGDRFTEIINKLPFKQQSKVSLMIQAVGLLLVSLFILIVITLNFFSEKYRQVFTPSLELFPSLPCVRGARP